VRGSSWISADYSANATLVAGGVNTAGVTIRTAALLNVSGGFYGYITAGNGVMILGGHTTAAEMANELFVPAGLTIALVRIAGTGHLGMTYDIH